jgi:acetyl esterase/lipase
MSVLARPMVAAAVARAIQRMVVLDQRKAGKGSRISPLDRLPEYPRNVRTLTIPTSIAPARVTVYLPTDQGAAPEVPAVHVNFHGGGYVIPLTEPDDPLCRYLAAEAGVVVINVDYVVAPQHRFPDQPRQAYEIVQWIAEHGDEQGWDGTRLSVGGQSPGGALATAVARQSLAQDGPAIALQVLHYPMLDLATDAKDKHAAIAKPMLRPWMAQVFGIAYVPDPRRRVNPLVSPANPADTEDLTGIAPALVITAENDLLQQEGARYADRLREAGSLIEHRVVAGVDHGYDTTADAVEQTKQTYALIASQIKAASASVSGA